MTLQPPSLALLLSVALAVQPGGTSYAAGAVSVGSASPPASIDCGSLQARVDAAAPSSVITLGECVFHETVTIDRPLTLSGPATITGDGEREYGVVVGADDVTLDGLTIVDTTNAAQDGAVRVRDSSRFVFRNGHILRAAGACISIAGGSGHRVLDSELAYCGQEGFHGTGLTDTVFARNHIHHNNPDLAFDPYWEAGAGKITRSTRVTFEGNEVDHNRGPGIWCDIDCRSITIRGNRIYANEQSGIFFEISTGATITGNAVWENGWSRTSSGWGAGILVSSSGGADVANNTVAWNADGITIISQRRRDRQPATDISVHDNVIALMAEAGDDKDKFGLAWLEDGTTDMFTSTSGNSGANNRYWASQTDRPRVVFAFDDQQGALDAIAGTAWDRGARWLDDSHARAAIEGAGVPFGPGPHVAQDDLPRRSLAIILAAVGGVVVVVVAWGVLVRRRWRRVGVRPPPRSLR
jgi:parallel beta-helix repeat protein